MAITESDIVFVLSGGSTNTSTDRSLGGNPSDTPMTEGLNGLFSDITNQQAIDGQTDYRCFYVFNDNATDTLRTVKIWVDLQKEDGATAVLGLALRNDLQLITVSGSVDGGSLDMELDADNFTFSWDADLAAWAMNLQDALNAHEGVYEARVSASYFSGVSTFQVSFQGYDGNRYFPLMTIANMNLTGTSVSASTTKLLDGSPINSSAPEIDLSPSAPAGVTFSDSTDETPIEVGNLRPTEGFPIWVKRVAVANTQPTSDDGFILGFEGDPVQ